MPIRNETMGPSVRPCGWLLALYLTLLAFSGCTLRMKINHAALAEPGTAFTQTWSFDFATNASYSFNSSSIDFTGGVCRLTGTDQVDNANDAAGFGGASLDGAAWDTTNRYVRLGSGGSCDSATTACANQTAANIYELGSSWTPQWASLVAYWKMNGSGSIPNGGIILDQFASSNASMSGGGTTYTTGNVAQGIQFDGTGYASIPVTAPANVCNEMTMSVWVKWNAPTTVSGATIATNWSGCSAAASWYFGQGGNGQVLEALVNTTGGFNQYLYGTKTPLDGSWHHVAMTVASSGTLSIFVDGVLDASRNVSLGAGICAPTQPISVGALGCTAGRFAGVMDEMAIWNNALTAAELSTIYVRQANRHSGTVTSRVMDALQLGMSWTTLSWIPTLPFLKELPDYASGAIQNETSADYSSLVGSAGTVGDDDLMSGVVGLWHLGESPGAALVKDSSGNGNSGTVYAGTTMGVEGKLGTTASIDGLTGYIGIADNPSLNFDATKSFTLQSWIKTSVGSAGANAKILVKRAGLTWYTLQLSGNSTGALELNGGWVISGGGDLRDSKWHHIVGVVNRSTGLAYIYIDGILRNSGAFTADTSNTAPLYIGTLSPSGNETFNGSIDEVAIWSRALDSKEILQLYRRGANRLKHQVRVCSTSDCSDDSTGANWKGPDGTNQTYFSELNNNTVPLAMSGVVKKGLPSMLFSAFTNPVGTSRYFQYRTILESDDTGTGCDYGSGATWCSPELKAVTVDPVHYDSSSPTVVGHTGVSYYSLATLTETLGESCASGIGYNLGVGATYSSATWYWWDATANSGMGGWVTADGTVTKSNSAATITSHAPAFRTTVGSGTVYFKAFLKSSGSTACELDKLDLSGRQ